jgi:hypothetical protein
MGWVGLKPALRVLGPLVAWGCRKTGAKHSQRTAPAHQFQAPPPEWVELWGRFSSILAIEQILGPRAETDSLNAWSDSKSARRTHYAKDSFEYEKLKQLIALG